MQTTDAGSASAEARPVQVRLPQAEYGELVRRSTDEHRTLTGHIRWLIKNDAEAHPDSVHQPAAA